MFKSISMATPNSTVTATFTADETCQVGVPEASVVRVNGVLTTSRDISLSSGDKIDMDVTSGPGNGSVFIPWTYNGNECYFGVASKAASNRPTLKSKFRGKLWFEIGGTTLFSYKTASTENTLGLNGTTSGTQTTDLAPVIDPASKSIYFIRADGAQVYKTTYPSVPRSHTYLWNGQLGSSGNYESYVLCEDGFIYRGINAQKSTATYPDIRTMWSDGVNLYLAGVNKFLRLSDPETISQTYTTTETINYGVSLASTTMLVTASGKILKVVGTTITVAYSAAAVGVPSTFKNQFVFPICEEFKLRIFSNTGNFIKDVGTGDLLPWATGASNRDDYMALAGADSNDVLIYSSFDHGPSTHTFNYRTSYATMIGAELIGSHYLRTTNLTVPPNPAVGGINFPVWQAPINVDTGSGEANVVTEAEILGVAAAPNAIMLVNGLEADTFLANQRVQMIMRSNEGRRSTAMVVGNYAFDFQVRAEETVAFTTHVDADNKFLAPQVVFDFVIPPRVVDAPIAVSHGTMMLNGSVYNGHTPVNGGDQVQVIINVPDTLHSYWSLVSLADAQFALTINSAVTRVVDIQRYQEYSTLDTVSTISVAEDGSYDFPSYTDAKVFKDDVELTFPVDLLKDDELVVHHTRMSSWWLDTRETVILGPSINYVVEGFTTVDDMPENVDFGIVHMGVPDFDNPGDLIPEITGLSEDYSIIIYNEYMTFSINGGAPQEKPLVQNGDKVQAIYRVKNLFETMWVKTDLYDGTVYEFGQLNIDPALGEWMPPRPSVNFCGDYKWAQFFDDQKALSASVPLYQLTSSKKASQSVPVRLQNKLGVSPTVSGKWINPQLRNTSAPKGLETSIFFHMAATSAGSNSKPVIRNARNSESVILEPVIRSAAPSAPLRDITHNRLFKTLASRSFKLATYVWGVTPVRMQDEETSLRLADTEVKHEPAFGHPATYTNFTPTFHHEQSISPREVTPFYYYQELLSTRYGETSWTRYGPAVFRRATTGWSYMAELPPRWMDPVYLYMVETILRDIVIDGTWMNEQVIIPKIINPTWATDVMIRNKVIQPKKALEQVYRSKPITSSWAADNRHRSKIITPLFGNHETMAQKTTGGKFSNGSLVSKTIAPKIVSATTYTDFSKAGVVHARHNWSYSNPVRAGGLPTSQAAEAEAVAYNDVLPVTVYEQPEGTFSYVFARDTSLVCELQGTNLYATKWLIGGG